MGGPAAQYLASRTLVGAVAGLRGRIAVPGVANAINASYDLSAGWPLKKPDNLKTQMCIRDSCRPGAVNGSPCAWWRRWHISVPPARCGW